MSRWSVLIGVGVVVASLCHAGKVQAVTNLWDPETPLTVTVPLSHPGDRLTLPRPAPPVADSSPPASPGNFKINDWWFPDPGQDSSRRLREGAPLAASARLGFINHKPRDPSPPVSAVPEPASLTLVGAGFLFLVFRMFSTSGKDA